MTKILGIRSTPENVRYALVSVTNGIATLENANGESRLSYPANTDDVAKNLAWFFSEIERIFRDNAGIEKVVIKTNEYGLTEKSAMRQSSYAEAVVLLYCAQKKIPVVTKTYASLGTRSADVKADAEKRVSKTAKYWDAKIADAVMAALWGAK